MKWCMHIHVQNVGDIGLPGWAGLSQPLVCRVFWTGSHTASTLPRSRSSRIATNGLSACMCMLPIQSVYSVWQWLPYSLPCNKIRCYKFIAHHHWQYRFIFISYLGITANLCSRSLLHRSWLLLHFLAMEDQPDPSIPLTGAVRWSFSSWHPQQNTSQCKNKEHTLKPVSSSALHSFPGYQF